MEKEMAVNQSRNADFGIMTFFDVNNYGALLQAYALQEKVIMHGYKAELLNYHEHKSAKKDINKRKNYLEILSSVNFNPKLFMNAYSAFAKNAQLFDGFRRDYLHIGSIPMYNMDDLRETEVGYRGIIAGSDMVWSDIGQNLAAFFLQFTEKEKRLSYAASLTGTLPEEADKYINGMSYLCCREEEGKNFIKEHTGKDAFVALDPTLLISKAEWAEKLSLNLTTQEEYLLCYYFGGVSKKLHKKLSKLAKKMNLKLRYLPMSIFENARNIENGYENGFGPREFVEIFFNAKFIVTNSFHGMIFSIIGEKPFAVLRREQENVWSKNEGRLSGMLKMLGVEKRLVSSILEVTEDFMKIDYTGINEILEKKRSSSDAYLKNMLDESYAVNDKKSVEAKHYETVADIEEKKCAGCGACSAVCPNGSITMIADEKEGFLKPCVDESQCIHCGVCVETCPASNEIEKHTPIRSYLGFSKLPEVKNSASGGVFFALGKYFIEELSGVVFGCILNSNMDCLHTKAENVEELYAMQGSKYVQSNITDCFAEIKNLLFADRWVLFSGTPCQVAGIKAYLKQDFPKLITVDLICHGVPSPMFWKKYVAHLSENGKLMSYKFRNKDNEAEFRSAYEAKITYKKKTTKTKATRDVFYNTFMKGESYRMSCYYCEYAKIERCGDITIGDCDSWREYENFYPEKTKSSILLNTEKGKEIFGRIQNSFLIENLQLSKEIAINGQLSRPAPMPGRRLTIYDDVSKLDWQDMERKYAPKRNLLFRAAVKGVNLIVKKN